jgi:hypothetical protein
MLTAAYQTDKENIKIQGEASDFIALHSTVRKVMLEAASYEQDHHEVSDFLIAFLEKLETAYDEKSFPGKPFCRACHPCPDHLIFTTKRDSPVCRYGSAGPGLPVADRFMHYYSSSLNCRGKK